MFLKSVRSRTLEVHVKEDEGYKFESVNHFLNSIDLDAEDLAGNLELSIPNNNLVTAAMYFPRKMLLIYAQKYPEETRTILKRLFNEDIDVSERITETQVAFNKLEQQRADEIGEAQVSNTYIGLRFISLLLGYMHPNKYNPLKPAEWKVFARYINPEFSIPNHTPAGEQYKMYCEYIDELREYLKSSPEITQIHDALVDGLAFRDTEYRWMTQDVIFVTAREYAHQKASEIEDIAIHTTAATQHDDSEDDSAMREDTGFMALEAHLEEYVVRNWHNIDFGEELRLYVETDGTTGQQYTTDVGIIDILAKDKDNNFVIIELKRADSKYHVVGQILNYISWVKDNLATDEQRVRGLIIVGKADKTLLAAIKPVSDFIELKEYSVKMKLTDPRV